MTKYARITGKVFGSSASASGADPEIGQFGSALAGTYNGTTDVATIQALPAWQDGFIGCVTPNTQFPPLPEMTGFGKVLSQQICYLLQQGIPEYDSGTTYYTGNWVSYNSSIYVAKADNFSNVAPTDTTKWNKFTGAGARNLGEYVTSSLPLTDDTLHLADGSLLTQTDYPELYSYVANLYNSLPTGDFILSTNGLPSKSNWSITYDGSKFVALSNDAYIYTSVDGDSWTSQGQISALSSVSDWCCICYGGGTYMAVSGDDYATSTNGTTWNSPAHMGGGTKISLIYNGSAFVANEDDGKLWIYSSGSWDSQAFVVPAPSSLSEGRYIGVAYNGTNYILITNAGYLTYNTDYLTSFSALTKVNILGNGTNWSKLIYENNKFLLLSDSGYVSTSEDGINWTTPVKDPNLPLTGNTWLNLACSNLETIAVNTAGDVYVKNLPSTYVFATEADWQAEYTAYGECGKYVYNSGANTVRIPAVNSYFTNTTNAQSLGDVTPASIPNIKGVISANEKLYKTGTSVSDYGAFDNVEQNVVSGQSDNSHFDNDLWDFDASRVSSVYSDSATTVNTQSIKQLVYIVVKK